MARCGCSQDRCGCNFVAGQNVSITGNGSRSDPFVVEAVIPESSGGGGGGGGGTPAARITGEIIAFGGAAPPSGWLVCDGSTQSRNVYPDLFAVIGVTFGAGNGTTTFNLPNYADRMIVGSGAAFPRGSSGGSSSNTLSGANLPAHNHTMSHGHGMNHDHLNATAGGGAHTHSEPRFNSGVDGTSHTTFRWAQSAGQDTNATDGDHTHTINIPGFTGNTAVYSGNTGTAGSGTAFNNMPPFQAALYLIKT